MQVFFCQEFRIISGFFPAFRIPKCWKPGIFRDFNYFKLPNVCRHSRLQRQLRDLYKRIEKNKRSSEKLQHWLNFLNKWRTTLDNFFAIYVVLS